MPLQESSTPAPPPTRRREPPPTSKISRIPAPVLGVLGTLEASFALSAAIALWAVLSFSFWPVELVVSTPMRGGAAPDPVEELVTLRQAADLGLSREVGLVERDGRTEIELAGVALADAPRTLHGLAGLPGLSAGETRFEPRMHVEQPLTQSSNLVRTMALQGAVFIVLGALLVRWRVPRLPHEPPWPWLRCARMGAGGGLVALVSSLTISGGLAVMGLRIQEQEWLRDLLADPENLWQLVPWVVVVLPISEEVFFRGYVLPLIGRRAGWVAGLLISSMMFAALHFNPTGLPVYLALGALFGWLRLRTSRLVAPIVAHVSYNGLALVLQTWA